MVPLPPPGVVEPAGLEPFKRLLEKGLVNVLQRIILFWQGDGPGDPADLSITVL